MRTCVLCDKKLTMWNVPSKSVRVLKDGSEICASCLQSKLKLIPDFNAKDYDQSELQAVVKEAKEKVSDLRFGNVNQIGIKKTLKDLSGNLDDSEELLGVIQVFDDEERNGGFYLTDKRILCICKGFGLGTQTTDFPYSKISSIDFKSTLLKSKITIHVSGNSSEYKVYDQELAEQIVKFVREKLVESDQKPDKPVESEDIFAQIEKLSQLKERGILSEEEFNSKKAELLKRI